MDAADRAEDVVRNAQAFVLMAATELFKHWSVEDDEKPSGTIWASALEEALAVLG